MQERKQWQKPVVCNGKDCCSPRSSSFVPSSSSQLHLPSNLKFSTTCIIFSFPCSLLTCNNTRRSSSVRHLRLGDGAFGGRSSSSSRPKLVPKVGVSTPNCIRRYAAVPSVACALLLLLSLSSLNLPSRRSSQVCWIHLADSRCRQLIST